MGVHDLRFISPNAVIVPVVQIITHPMFNRTTADNDIAIVEFQFPIVFTPNISPICLPFPNMDLTWQTVITMGWGLTQFGKSICLVIISYFNI